MIICNGNKIHDLDNDVIRHWIHLMHISFDRTLVASMFVSNRHLQRSAYRVLGHGLDKEIIR